MSASKKLSRRRFLRGAIGGTAVALALPTLEATLSSRARAEGTGDPFFGLLFWANCLPWHAGHGGEQASAGMPDLWTPAGATAESPLLAELQRHRVSVATGLQPHTEVPPTPPGQGDGHMRGFMVGLTGDRIRPEGFDHPSHTLTALRPTLDQYIAKHPDFYGDLPTRFRSVQVGVSTARFHDYGHWNAVSYNGPDSLNLPILQPSQLYAQLFAVPPGADVLERRARLLDAVMDDARSLQSQLGAGDRMRVEEHLDHLSEIQRRFNIGAGTCEAPAPPSDGGDLLQKTETMGQLLAVALKCNLTRVFSFMLTSPATTHVFSNLGVPDGMHKTCHDGHWERVRAIAAHQMAAFARFLDTLEATEEPTGGTLMDRACILGVSEYGEGWKHGTRELPVVLAGGASGALARGVHVREDGGNVVKAHLTILRALGLEHESWGWNGGEVRDHLPGLI